MLDKNYEVNQLETTLKNFPVDYDNLNLSITHKGRIEWLINTVKSMAHIIGTLRQKLRKNTRLLSTIPEIKNMNMSVELARQLYICRHCKISHYDYDYFQYHSDEYGDEFCCDNCYNKEYKDIGLGI